MRDQTAQASHCTQCEKQAFDWRHRTTDQKPYLKYKHQQTKNDLRAVASTRHLLTLGQRLLIGIVFELIATEALKQVFNLLLI